jgi:hypothetical protein
MAPQLTCFSRNRCTLVEQIDERTLRSSCRLQDTLTEAHVEITVRLPDLEITGATAAFRRTPAGACRELNDALAKLTGVRVGPGMLKIIKGLVGEKTTCSQLAFMVEECCHGVILSMTKDSMGQRPADLELTSQFFAEMVRQNTRLYNRCAAFAPGSSLVEGIEPPK